MSLCPILGAANNLLAAAIDTRMFHEKTQTDKQLFDRLCPVDPLKKDDAGNVIPNYREYAPIMLKRLRKLGIYHLYSLFTYILLVPASFTAIAHCMCRY